MGTRKKGLEFAKHITEIIAKSTGFERHLEKVKITGGGDGVCTAEFKVAPEHLNMGGGLHGGYTATLVDMVTTYALMSKPCHPGVSVDLSVSYLKGAREGDEVLIEAKTVRAGKKLAFIDCVLRHKKDNSVIAKGHQTKFVDFQ
ncbi:acyl-coenzyme A thioesterase 13-like [Scaptodrosophila lebanonensis]|uniref:Acyl-coenzyme A thioesterase 13 n=1 Tax=Drosophila lebanonensis TaxID=7225 RepID=A0A6J2T9X2_DROLE|nr:acyl-coenzyme A thioesterase 13 [Scaptodrosophila lebanonensis]XP_030372136.1 acyl-coenzyme A thioesterase 13-like [Scaptodrosophila lebanonensis]